jgi:hypothetical protein
MHIDVKDECFWQMQRTKDCKSRDGIEKKHYIPHHEVRKNNQGKESLTGVVARGEILMINFLMNGGQIKMKSLISLMAI